jgi:hypothetical protein
VDHTRGDLADHGVIAESTQALRAGLLAARIWHGTHAATSRSVPPKQQFPWKRPMFPRLH